MHIWIFTGGITYQVPYPLSDKQSEFMALKWFRDTCKEKSAKGRNTFERAVAEEALAAYQNEGLVIQRKQEHHKQCEANRAYAHFRPR